MGTGGNNFSPGNLEGPFSLQKAGFSEQLTNPKLTIPFSFPAFSLYSEENS